MKVGKTTGEAKLTILAEGLQFPEGPLCMPDGSLMLVEVASGRLIRIAPNGRAEVAAEAGGGPNGLALGPDGAVYICNNGGNAYNKDHFAPLGASADYTGGSIQRYAPGSRRVETLYTQVGEHRLSAPNDIVFDAAGGFYFTDMGKRLPRHREHGGVYYAQPDGSSIEEVVFPMLTPNGISLSPDQRLLYVTDTETSRVVAFDISGPGRVEKHPFPAPHGGRVLCGLPGFQRFDGMAVSASGNLTVATLVTGCLTRIGPDGSLVEQIVMPDIYPTNIAFGGPDMCTAYVTFAATGKLAAMAWSEPGLKLNWT